MNRSSRWVLAAGATFALGLGAIPAASATAASPTSSATAASTAAVAQSALADRFGIDRLPVAEAVKTAVDDTQPCAPTEFDSYVDNLINSMSREELIFLVNNIEMLDIPTYDALLFGTTSDARYNLRSDYRRSLTTTFADVKRFWDIKSGDIQLISMHGEMLKDQQRVARMLQVDLGIPGFGLSKDAALAKAKTISEGISKGLLGGGTNPLFTLNAFAFSAEGDPDPLVKDVPDKLVFGDGIVDALNTLGLGDVGPRAVMGHEFGHHVQFEDDLFDSPLTGPEATRRTELMADAFGTYFTVHARGLALNAKRVLQVEKSFYEVGDCQFSNEGHHGTPLQRLAASTWGAEVAATARPQGFILPSLKLDDMFEAKLSSFVATPAS
ncbi:MAG: hypothetical protein ACTHMW_13860 [Actinomycetes bacterium]